MCLLHFLLCVTAKCYVSYICIKVAIYFGNLNVKNRYVSWVLWSVQWRDIIINSVSKCTLLLSALLPCLNCEAGQVKLFSFFLPKSLVRVRPVSRKCVGRADQSATCLCALYLSQCSILVCVCFVLVCIRFHCLYEFKVYVCSVFVCVLNSMYLFASWVLLGILFIISVSSSSSNALLLVCYLCVCFFGRLCGSVSICVPFCLWPLVPSEKCNFSCFSRGT